MFKHYLTTALRHFHQHKLTTSINIACLAMGLVCFIFAYGVGDYFRQSDTYHEKAARTYALNESLKIGGADVAPVMPRTSLVVAKLIKADFPSLELVARASTFNDKVPLAAEGNTQFVKVSFADADFLKIFDLPFIAGDARNALTQPHSVVITQEVARHLFGTSDPMGKSILLSNRETVHITGIVAEPKQPSHVSTTNTSAALYFQALVSMDVNEALIAASDPPDLANHKLNLPYGFMWYQTYVVLPQDGTLTIQNLNQQLKSFSAKHVDKTATNIDVAITARPASQITVSFLDAVTQTSKTGVSAPSLLLALGALVLAIATLNYANLASAQAATRSKEVALRRVVGAGRAQIVTQYVFEAALSVGVALTLALLSILTLSAFLTGPLHVALSLILFGNHSLSFWGFILILFVSVSVLASIYPALVMARVQPGRALRDSRVNSGGRFASSLFVGAQFFASSFLLIAVIVMASQNKQLRIIGFGAADDPVVAIANNVRTSGIDMQLLRTELLRHSQVQAVTATMFPLGIMSNDAAQIFQSPESTAKKMTVALQLVDYDFFATMKIKLLAGRVFDHAYGSDISSAESERPPGNILIDLNLLHRLGWKTAQQALGQTIYVPGLANGANPKQPSTVIGVVEDKPLFAINVGGTGIVYQLVPTLTANPLIRISRTDISGALAAIDTTWKKIAPSTALDRHFLDEQFAEGLMIFDLITSIFTRLAVFALVISTVGLMAMAAHIVARRTHEIGVRKTLGASVLQVLTLLLKDLSKPVLIANLVAWPLGFGVMSIYLSIFVTRTSLSPAPFIASLLITLLIAWLAIIAQATRAARMNPASVLRYE